jgi:tight adherence protein B
MDSVMGWLVSAAAFAAVVLLIQGLWLALRNRVGAGRRISLRFAATAGPSAAATPLGASEGPMSQAFDKRFPWLASAVARSRAPFTALQLAAAAAAGAASLVAVLLILRIPWPVAVIVALGLGTAVPVLLVTYMAGRRQAAFLNQLPQAVDLVARALQAGHPVTSAMTVVAKQMQDPIGPEFGLVIEEMTYGLDRDAALHGLVARFPVAELRMFVASLEVTRETGGNLAEVFLKLAESIRAKAHLRRKVHAITAEGRMSFWVVSALPIVVGSALMLLRPTFYTEVMADPLFWPLMAISPVMLAIGATLLWRMVNLKI